MAQRGKRHTKRKRKRPLPPYDPNADMVRGYHLPYAVGFGEVTAWRLRRAGRFPDPIRITDTVNAWIAAELREWRRTRERARTGQG